MSKEATIKWFWKMSWCRKEKVSPASAYWWNKAERKYQELKKKEETRNLSH